MPFKTEPSKSWMGRALKEPKQHYSINSEYGYSG
jgi:hypothetical protein